MLASARRAGPLRVEPIGLAGAKPPAHGREVLRERFAERPPQRAPGAMDGVHVDPLHAVGEIALGRQGEGLGRERSVDGLRSRSTAPIASTKAGSAACVPGGGSAAGLGQAVEPREGEGLPRVPPRERIGVVGRGGR